MRAAGTPTLRKPGVARSAASVAQGKPHGGHAVALQDSLGPGSLGPTWAAPPVQRAEHPAQVHCTLQAPRVLRHPAFPGTKHVFRTYQASQQAVPAHRATLTWKVGGQSLPPGQVGDHGGCCSPRRGPAGCAVASGPGRKGACGGGATGVWAQKLGRVQPGCRKALGQSHTPWASAAQSGQEESRYGARHS